MLRTQIEKQINILDYALSSIWRRKFKNISVMLVFGAVIFLLASFQMVTQALTEAAADSLVAAPEITLQRMSAGRQEAIPLAYRDRLASIFGIRKIVPRIWGYYFDETHLANYTVMGLDTSAMPQGGLLNQALASGRFPRTDENDGVVVGQSIVALKKLADRRLFSLFRPDLSLKPVKMLGVFDDKTDLLTNDLIVMSMAAARDLFSIETGRVTDFAVYVANPAEIETIAKKIAKILPDTRVVTRPQVQKTYQVVFGWRSGFGSICLLTALAAFVILAWDKASGLTPEEKKEISILKILGWETADILAIRFWESFWVAGIAFIVGCTLAYIHVAFFGAALFRPVMIGWSVIYPVFRLPPSISFADLLLIFCFSVVPYLAATIIPAWRSATVPPDAAIR
jgi:ABC-type lipoprotein release transport system permease subunit